MMTGKTFMKRSICFLMVLLMLTGTLSGCRTKKTNGGTQANQTTAGTGQPTPNPAKNPTTPAQGGTTAQNNSSGAVTPKPGGQAGSQKKDILTIAEKYYNARLPLLHPDLKQEFTDAAGKVSFSGTESQSGISAKLRNLAAIETAFSLNGDFAVLTAVSAVAKDASSSDAAHTLAAVLLEAMFLDDPNRLQDALACVTYAITIRETWEYNYTLAQIHAEMERYQDALTAIDRALELEPGNFTCIEFKIALLKKMGGSAAAIKALEKQAEEQDGDLGKRLKEQENDTEGFTHPDAEESKEKLRKKYDDILSLEPITIADMFDRVYPEGAAQLKEKIMQVSESDRFKLPVFPDKLFKSASILEEECFVEATEYGEWLNDTINELTEKANESVQQAYDENYTQQFPEMDDFQLEMMQKFEANQDLLENMTDEEFEQWMQENFGNMDSDESQMDPDEAGVYDKTNVELMMDYNTSVANAGLYSFAFYALALRKEFTEASMEAYRIMTDKVVRNRQQREALIAKAKPEEIPVIALEYDLKQNGFCEEYVKSLLPLAQKDYARVSQMAHEVWEDMLPYIRGSHMPEVYITHYQAVVMQYSLMVLQEVTFLRGTPYVVYISAQDLEAAKEALAEYQKYIAEMALAAANSGVNIKLTLDLEIVKINLTPNSAELELLVAHVAARAQYDWKKDELELGAGVGAKLSAGAKFIKVEAKVLGNVVIDLKKNKISDVYVSSEASFNMGNYGVEAGGKVSVLGKGSSLYSGVTAGKGRYSVGHRQELISQ